MKSELITTHPDSAFTQAVQRVKLLGIDFDGVMTDNSVFVFEDGREAVRCSRFDGFGLKRLRSLDIEAMIISTEKNPVVSARAKKLGVACIQSVDDKVAVLQELLSERGLDWSQAGFIGYDINDAGVLERVGLPVVVADAHPSINTIQAFQTTVRGGYGAVRELCDKIAECIEAQ